MVLTWLALGSVGLFAGILGAILGLGGGIFLVPILTLIFGLPIRVAVGASLFGVIATSAGVAVVSRPGRGPDTRLAMRLEIASTSAALLASLAASWLSQSVVTVLFGAVALAMGGYTALRTRRRSQPTNEAAVDALFRTGYRPRNWPAGMALAGLAGALSGLTGIGGGFIKVPVMHSVMDVPLGVATATSNFMVGITAVASALVYYSRGDIHPAIAVPASLGVFAGAITGARIASRLRVDALRWGLIILLALIGIYMTWRGLVGG